MKSIVVVILSIFVSLSGTAQDLPENTFPYLGIAKDIYGYSRPMTYDNAAKYCACDTDFARSYLNCKFSPNFARLPTAREMAMLAVQYGAEGVTNTDPSPKGAIKYVTKNYNLSWDTDIFFYRIQGYQKPASDLGRAYFWTQSTSVGVQYHFEGPTGYLNAWPHGRDVTHLLTLCISKR